MFERYTEAARRTIFVARDAALAEKCIESNHLLLGLLHCDKALTIRVLGSETAGKELYRKALPSPKPVKRNRAENPIPLSDQCKRILCFAVEEADNFRDAHIGTEHLLLGVLRERQCVAAQMLNALGVELDAVRQAVRETQPDDE